VPATAQLFGREFTYLGGSDLALRVIIWSIPIGFINSVTQYVLIAVNQQHFLTRAFIVGVLFNVVGNLMVIPYLGYVGAALITILSELILLFPFYACVRQHVGVVAWAGVFARPLAALAVMGAADYWLVQVMGMNLWLAAALGVMVYGAALAVMGALRGEEMQVLRRVMPFGNA
jgi:O-antigen/teichoic acid export membrane protein